MPDPFKVAAIDIGSNSIKMTLGRSDGAGGLVESDWATETVRLGAGLDQSGRLADDRIEAALGVLRRFAANARAAGATRVLGVATEAVRVAANGEAFVQRVRDEAGVEARVISGDEEADLTFRGLSATTDLAGAVLVADIGGASTEVIPAVDGVRLGGQSLPLGSGRLTDRHVHHDPPSAEEIAACRDAAHSLLATHPDLLHPAGLDQPRLVAVGGTGEYLAQLVGHQPFGVADVDAVLAELVTVPAADLASRLGIAEARARVLPAGIAVVRALADAADPRQIETARSGIRTGLLIRALEAAREGRNG